jgi:MFS transporter, CP family, cyanate transporter
MRPKAPNSRSQEDDMAHDAAARIPRLLLGAGIVGTAFTLRLVFASLSVRLPELTRDIGLTRYATSALVTLPVLCLGLCAPFAARIGKRWGIERTLFGALTLLVCATVLRASGSGVALFAFSILAAAAIAIANVLLPSLVKRDFADRTALLTGLYVTAISGGAAIAAGTTVPLEHALDASWHTGLAIWALPPLCILLLWLPLLARCGTMGASGSVRMARLLRNRLAWQVAIFMGLQSALAFTALSWLAPLLRERGLSAVTAGLVVSALTLVQLATSLTTPALATRSRDQRPLAVLLAVGGVGGMLGLLLAPLSTVWFWALLQGLAQGGLFSLALTLVVLRAPDSDIAAQLSGMAQSIGYIPAACAPLAVGLIRAATGSFAAVGWLLALIGLGLVWSGLGAGRPAFVQRRG